MKKEIKTEEGLDYGLISCKIEPEDFENYEEFINSFFSEAELKAVVKLRETWKAGSRLSTEDELAAERLAFRNCFKEGAAESIAAYLENRFKTN